MSKKVDWKQAMLNEAEASESEAWAKETRRAVLFNPHEISWRQALPVMLASAVGAVATKLIGNDVFTALSAGVCAQATGCSLSIGLTMLGLSVCYVLIGAFLFWRGIGALLMIVFAVVAGTYIGDLAFFDAINIEGWRAFAVSILLMPTLVALPLSLGYRAAYELALRRAEQSGRWVEGG